MMFMLAMGLLACGDGAGGDSPPPDPAAAPRTGGGSIEQPAPFDTSSRLDVGGVTDTAAPPPR
jgi:hypothetical protein